MPFEYTFTKYVREVFFVVKGLFEFEKVLKCTLLSVITTIILGGILAFLVYFLPFEETTVEIVVFAIMIVSVLFGSFVLAKNVAHNGLLNGLLMAILYFAAILLTSFVLGDKISVGVKDITRLVTLSAAGMLGGVLGINT